MSKNTKKTQAKKRRFMVLNSEGEDIFGSLFDSLEEAKDVAYCDLESNGDKDTWTVYELVPRHQYENQGIQEKKF